MVMNDIVMTSYINSYFDTLKIQHRIVLIHSLQSQRFLLQVGKFF